MEQGGNSVQWAGESFRIFGEFFVDNPSFTGGKGTTGRILFFCPVVFARGGVGSVSRDRGSSCA